MNEDEIRSGEALWQSAANLKRAEAEIMTLLDETWDLIGKQGDEFGRLGEPEDDWDDDDLLVGRQPRCPIATVRLAGDGRCG